MSAKELLDEATDAIKIDCLTTEERDTTQCTFRALLVAALIDEGWRITTQDEGTAEQHSHAIKFTDKPQWDWSAKWPGTIADMPQDTFNELKGSLK